MMLGRSHTLRRANLSLLVLLALTYGCDRSSRPAPPVTAPASQPTKRLMLISSEAEQWTAEEAFVRLSDPQENLSAAIQLVRLSGRESLCIPAEMTDTTASCLRVARISEELWALGLSDVRSDQVLRAPVLLARDGGAFALAGGTEEELLCLHVARDPDVFPHLLISPRHVWVIQTPPERALRLERPDDVGFSWRQEQGFPYVALSGGQSCNFAEIARYLWDPYELAFTGPAAGALPDPPGGKFELDLPASPKLIPIGGDIPKPKPLPKEPPHFMGDDRAAAPVILELALLKLEPSRAARYRMVS